MFLQKNATERARFEIEMLREGWRLPSQASCELKLSTNNEDDESWRNLNGSELYFFETSNAHRTFVLNSLRNISDVAGSFPLDISRMERGAV